MIHYPRCNPSCDPATGAHHLEAVELDPDAGRDNVLEDEGLEEDTNLERPEPWLYRLASTVRGEWGGFTCWLGINHHCLVHCTHPTTHPTAQALA